MTCNFTHLHVHTEYSLLDGASKPAELIAYAKELGMDSIAITDHGSMYGAVSFYKEAKKQGVKPIIGCEVYVTSPSRHNRSDQSPRYHLILLAENNTGYHNLARLVSLGYLEGFYRKPRIDKDILRQYHEGLIALSACVAGEIPAQILNHNLEGAERSLREYLDIFGPEHFYLELQNHGLEEERTVRAALHQLAVKYQVKLVATNDLHYVKREDAAAQDVLLCIQTNKTVDDPERMRFSSDDYYCKSLEEMQQLFPEDAEALANTHAIAERCQVDFEFGHLLLPEFPIPEAYEGDADVYLSSLCQQAVANRYAGELAACTGADGVPDEAARRQLLATINKRLEYELSVIKTMGYSCYFLIVWDFINYCRNVKPEPIPVGPGRGSAAGSIVAYLLHITNIEPLKYDLLFERFLNPERVSMPDIDTDFCYKRRDEVLQYVIKKYGADRVALIITFGTLQARAAVRDVGRALGIPLAEVDRVAKAVPRELGITLEKALQGNKELRELYDTDPKVKRLIDIAKTVEGLPRNSGTHAAGVVIAPKPLIDYVPLQLADAEKVTGSASREDWMITTQYDKDLVEELGFLKMDFLGLRTLTVIADAVKFIRQSTGKNLDIDHIPLDDELTCAMLRRGDTQGVFQLESAGMTHYVVESAPRAMKDLVPLVALYRPGPLDAGMAEDYIAGCHGRKTAESLHPLLDPILADTHGVILYQEQVMQVTSVLAGFSLGEADVMRRAMGKKKLKVLMSMKEKFVEGAARLHQVPREQSEHIFGLLEKFAGYGFNKSHSVAYALVAYQTAYLKAHWPAEFFAAFISSVSDNGDKLNWYLAVCKDRGLKILPPDVNYSQRDFSVEQEAVRFGLGGVKSVGDRPIEDILAARRKGPFVSILDFCKRVDSKSLNRKVLENLIKCGALDSLGAKRSQLLSVYENALDVGQRYQKDHASGQIGLFENESFAELNEIKLPNLQEMPRPLLLKYEKELVGFYVTGHPLDDYKPLLAKYTPLYTLTDENTTIRDGQFVKVAGIVSQCNIKITKKGDSMAVLTLEDFSSKISVIVFPKTYSECSRFLAQDMIIGVEGRYSVDEREQKVNAAVVLPLEEHAKLLSRGFRNNYGGSRFRNGESFYEPKGSLPAAPKVQESSQGYGAPAQVEPDGASVIYLRIAPELETSAITQKLQEILRKYSGNNLVFLDLLGSRKRVRLDPRLYIDARSKGVQAELEKLLGAGSFVVRQV